VIIILAHDAEADMVGFSSTSSVDMRDQVVWNLPIQLKPAKVPAGSTLRIVLTMSHSIQWNHIRAISALRYGRRMVWKSRLLLYNRCMFRSLVYSCPLIASIFSNTRPLRSVLANMRFLSGIVFILSSVTLLGYAYPSSIDVRGTGFVL
jgi:hypothetical protein